MTSIFIKMSILLSISFLFSNHPLTMGLILLLQTISLSLISGSMSPSFWFSYILLMIYVGGMLILFMYVTSLIPNKIFFFPNKMLMLMFFISTIMMMYMLQINPLHNSYENLENNYNLSLTSNKFLIKMYNQPTNIMTIMIAIYLFLTLIAVIKITNIHKGPLRQIK
uniref:NADH-ubiquinone oxidoreductase chain 6 n=1 Tax=Haania sp. JZ-2017 TaxID=2073092 RepID=A0A343UN20_9NEOP|nr:NADH dehydrogenase subunit 6 [Haania sp. JZ-2017]